MQEENNRKISICVEKHTLEHKRKRIRKLDILVKNRRKLKSIKKGYLSQTANLFVNLKSNTMKNTNKTRKKRCFITLIKYLIPRFYFY